MSKETNTNCLSGLACLKCGSLGPFDIAVTCTARVWDSGIEETSDSEWDDESSCSCRECGFRGVVDDFSVDDEKTYEFTVTLRGRGNNKNAAWQDAIYAFTADPGDFQTSTRTTE